MRSLIGASSALEIQRATHCIASSCERGDEAVALALLDRAHPAVLSNEL